MSSKKSETLLNFIGTYGMVVVVIVVIIVVMMAAVVMIVIVIVIVVAALIKCRILRTVYHRFYIEL